MGSCAKLFSDAPWRLSSLHLVRRLRLHKSPRPPPRTVPLSEKPLCVLRASARDTHCESPLCENSSFFALREAASSKRAAAIFEMRGKVPLWQAPIHPVGDPFDQRFGGNLRPSE